MERTIQTDRQPGRRAIWFNLLLLVDALALGGLLVWKLVLSLLESAMAWSAAEEAIRTFVGLDHLLFPYWVAHIGISFLLLCITAGAYLWLRTSSRIISAVPLIVPLVLFVWLLISRR